MCRPLIIIEKGISKLKQEHIQGLGSTVKLEDLLEDGIIEYIDVNEENNCLIALDERQISIEPPTTHMEIGKLRYLITMRLIAYDSHLSDPMTILGIVVGLVPYPHHNQVLPHLP